MNNFFSFQEKLIKSQFGLEREQCKYYIDYCKCLLVIDSYQYGIVICQYNLLSHYWTFRYHHALIKKNDDIDIRLKVSHFSLNTNNKTIESYIESLLVIKREKLKELYELTMNEIIEENIDPLIELIDQDEDKHEIMIYYKQNNFILIFDFKLITCRIEMPDVGIQLISIFLKNSKDILYFLNYLIESTNTYDFDNLFFCHTNFNKWVISI